MHLTHHSWEHPTFLINTLEGYSYTDIRRIAASRRVDAFTGYIKHTKNPVETRYITSLFVFRLYCHTQSSKQVSNDFLSSPSDSIYLQFSS
jgi:hypothetical protein